MRSSQGLVNVTPQILNIFNADAQSDEAGYNPCGNTDIFWNKHVAGIERAFNE